MSRRFVPLESWSFRRVSVQVDLLVQAYLAVAADVGMMITGFLMEILPDLRLGASRARDSLFLCFYPMSNVFQSSQAEHVYSYKHGAS